MMWVGLIQSAEYLNITKGGSILKEKEFSTRPPSDFNSFLTFFKSFLTFQRASLSHQIFDSPSLHSQEEWESILENKFLYICISYWCCWEDSPGEGHGKPLQYSCLENPMDRRLAGYTVHGVMKNRTWLKWLSMHTLVLRTNLPENLD